MSNINAIAAYLTFVYEIIFLVIMFLRLPLKYQILQKEEDIIHSFS